MTTIPNWDNIQESGSKRIKAGGYICKINSVKDVTDKQYLLVELDVADGEFAKYYEEMMAQKGFWGLKHFASYKEKAQGLFKHFISCVEKSNSNYKFDFNESTLVNKFVGIVLGFEEYIGNDGAIKQRVKVVDILPVEDIKNGNFEIPELKKLAIEQQVQEEEIPEDELPF